MKDRNHRQDRGLGGGMTRRGLLGAAAGAGALGVSIRFGRRADAQATTLQSWGFTATETNPLAFARLQAFQAAHPEITLEISPEGDTQRILTAAISDTLPDLLWLDRGFIDSYVSRGDVLLSLDDLVARDSYDMSRFYPAAVAESTYDDKLYGIPGGMDVVAMYANNAILGAAGIDPATLPVSDWAAMGQIGAQLTVNESGSIRQWGYDPKSQDGQIYTWTKAAGLELLTGDSGNPSFNTPDVVALVEQMTATYTAQAPFDNYSGFRSTWQNDEQFARGQVAITAYQNWMANIISATTPDLDFTVLPVRPAGDPNGIAAVSGGRSWCITSGSQNADAAWEFIKFMHSDETWMVGAQAVRDYRDANQQPYVPSLTGCIAVDQRQIDELYTPLAPNFDAAVKLFPQLLQASDVRPFGRSPYALALDSAFLVTGVLSALRGERSAQEAMDAAQSEAEGAITGF